MADTGAPAVAGGISNDRLFTHVVPGLALSAILLHVGFVASGAHAAEHVTLVWLGLGAYGFAFTALAGSFSTRAVWSTYVLPGLCIAAYVIWLGVGHLENASVVNPAYEQYQTDSLAFSVYSAQLVLRGEDPYAVSMAPASQRFKVSPTVYTPTTDGGRVSLQPYPALNFLIYVPFLLAHVQSMIWVDIGFQIAAMLLVLALVPSRLRTYFGLFFLIIPEYREFAVGSVTDVVWLPFMIGVAASWDRRPALCAVLLGLACAIKQEPWFVVPFALVHWSQIGGSPFSFSAVRNFAFLAAAFLIPNLPFLAWHPSAWIAGVFSPLLSHAVPLGSGLIALQTSGLVQLPLSIYTVLWVGTLVVCVAVYAVWPARSAWLPFAAPALVLFFSPRSLQNYFVYWPIILAVYAATAPAQRLEALSRETSMAAARAVAAATAAVVAFVGLLGAAAAGEHVTTTVERVTVDPQTGYADRIVLAVDNPTARAVSLHFAIAGPLNSIVFWRSNVSTVAPHTRARIELSPDGLAGEVPTVSDGFQVVAFAPREALAVYTRAVHPDVSGIRGVRNGTLLSAVNAFQMLPVQAPLAWEFDPRPFLDGRLAIVHDGPFGSALRFSVPSSPRSTSSVVKVSQTFMPAGRRYTFWLKPAPAGGRKAPGAQMLAVVFTDARGRQTYFVADPAANRVARWSRNADEFVRLPARPGAWNRYTVDLTQLPVPAALGPLTVTVLEAVHAARSSRASGEFGGIGQG